MNRHDDHTAAWRLIDTGPLSGPENMAIDEALLLHFDPQSSAPVLRLYGWEPAALSLGRFQKASEELDLAEIERRGLPLVRRITGGGAIYHADELTYSIVCSPQQIPPTTSIKDSFRVLTSFLLDFYSRLGLSAGYAMDIVQQEQRLGQRTAYCFAGKESYDILINGRKIGGNAQRRLKQAIFQHGSVPLRDHLADGLACLAVKPAGVSDAVTCLEGEGLVCNREELAALLADSFCSRMGGLLQPDTLTQAEKQTAADLADRKYSACAWNIKGESVCS